MKRALIILVISACGRPSHGERDPSRADLELSKVRIKSYADGALSAVTTADRVDVYRQTGTPGDIVAWDAGVLLMKDGTKLHAAVMRGNFNTGQLEGSGGVTMEKAGDVRASSPTVFFEREKGASGEASSDAGVVFHKPGMDVTAEGFWIDVGDEHATLENMTTTIVPTQ